MRKSLRREIARLLPLTVVAVFTISVASKSLHASLSISDFARMVIIGDRFAGIALILAVCIEFMIAFFFLLRDTRSLGCVLGISYLVFVTMIYMTEWYVTGSVPACGCGLEILGADTVGGWLAVRNLLLAAVLWLIYKGRLNTSAHNHTAVVFTYGGKTLVTLNCVVALVALNILLHFSTANILNELHGIEEAILSKNGIQ